MVKLGEFVDEGNSRSLVGRCSLEQLQSLALVAKHNPAIATEVIAMILASSEDREVLAAE